MNDIKVEALDSEQREQYINATALEAQSIQIEDTYESGTLKITKELAEQAKEAITSRIDGVDEYTKDRLERVNNAFAKVEQKVNTEANSKMNYPLITNSVEDWVDDLFLMYSTLKDSIEVDGKELHTNIVRKQKVDENDFKGKQGKLLSLLNKVTDKFKQTDMYYFKKHDIVKDFMKDIVEKSGYDTELEAYLRFGVIGGLFVYKGDFGNVCKDVVIMKTTEDGKDKYVSQDKFVKKVQKKQNFRFKAIDQRRLIFKKEFKDWVFEIIDTSFSDLVNATIGEDGKPKKNSKYDIKVLDKIKEYIKDGNQSSMDIDNSQIYGSNDEDEYSMSSEIFAIDGNIKVYECHNVPMIINKRVVSCQIITLYINEDHIPISIMPTYFRDGTPYGFCTMFNADNDISGRGVPDKLLELQKMNNDIFNFMADMIAFSIKGVTVGDKSKICNPAALSSIKAGDFIQLKNMEGQPIQTAFDWVRPPVDMLGNAENFMALIQRLGDKTSRKGSTGEKVAPNPSATEFDSIMKELEKSVNRQAIRMRSNIIEMLEDSYVYTMLNRDERTHLKSYAHRIKSNEPVLKTIELQAEELYIDGIGFNITVLDNDVNAMAVERKQTMEAVDLLLKVGAKEETTDPMTGQPTSKDKTFTGEGGEELVLDEYKIIKKAFSKLGYSTADIFKPKEQEQQPAQQPAQQLAQPQAQAPQAGQAGQGGAPTANGVGVPNQGAQLGSAVTV